MEFDRYINAPISKKDRKILDPIGWWIQHQSEYPILSKMALDIFSTPAMSTEVERAFSQAKKLVTDERNQLGRAMVEACECLKQWQAAGVIKSV